MKTCKEVLEELKAKNPDKTDADLLELLCDFMDMQTGTRGLIGFLCSGYHDGKWKFGTSEDED